MKKEKTYTPPHLFAAPDNAALPDKHTHAIAEVRDPNDCVMGTRFWDYAYFRRRDMGARAVKHGKEGSRRSG
jgi:hypothetical protein